MAGQGVRVCVGGKTIQKKQSSVKIDATVISCSTMLPRFTLSTMIPQMGYRSTLPLSKYAAEVLASNSASSNRRSKIFLSTRSLSPIEHGVETRTYGARCTKGCQIDPHRTFNAIYLPEMVVVLSQSWKHNLYARPNDITKLDNLSDLESSLFCHLLNDLSLCHVCN